MHKVLTIAAMLAVVSAAPARAQVTEEQLADAMRFGGVATLGPICGLRDEAWGADLRRAMIGATTRSAARDDPGLRAAPGSDLVIGALSFAEAEALESFAEAPAPETCEPLAHDPLLGRADAMVKQFRQQPGS